MARRREVVSDMNSLEVDELRRNFNALLLVLENIATAVDAGDITADEAFTVLLTSIAAGTDASITGVDGGANNYTGTDLEVVGVKPTPLQPRQPRASKTVPFSKSDRGSL